ncbi:hypothetical protein FXO38_29736 [Capsicum annuum]|nr:hypothetical protein FXO38_29736 [Capsicum annuum]KAF3658019.1 hypothetical protein FXO37_14613 [Capsicum annuum]
MSDFTLIILRWYHGGVLDLSSGEPVYKDSATAYSASISTAAPIVPTSTAALSVAISTAAAASVASPSAAATSVAVGSAAVVDDIDVGPAGRELVGDDTDEEYGTDVHEEVKELRADKRKFQRRKIKKRVPADNAEVPVGEAGPDLGFDDTETGKVSHEGRLGGDEPYFASSDEGSFELDEDDCCGDE